MGTEITLQNFIEEIKKEGIEGANKEKEAIISDARSKAEAIINEAKREADTILDHAKQEIQKNKAAFETSMTQSGRDLILSLQQEIIRLLDKIVEREISGALTPELIKEIIIKIVDKWKMDERSCGIEILLNEEDRQKLEDTLFDALQDEWKKGVILKPIDSIQAGFRIGEKNGGVHYDFTEKGIAEALSAYLNQRVSRFLKGSEKETEEKD